MTNENNDKDKYEYLNTKVNVFDRPEMSTEEKLVVCKYYIKDLKKQIRDKDIEIGTLISEKDELTNTIKLINSKGYNIALTLEEKLAIKVDTRVIEQKERIKALEKRIVSLKQDNENLIIHNIQLQKKD